MITSRDSVDMYLVEQVEEVEYMENVEEVEEMVEGRESGPEVSCSSH